MEFGLRNVGMTTSAESRRSGISSWTLMEGTREWTRAPNSPDDWLIRRLPTAACHHINQSTAWTIFTLAFSHTVISTSCEYALNSDTAIEVVHSHFPPHLTQQLSFLHTPPWINIVLVNDSVKMHGLQSGNVRHRGRPQKTWREVVEKDWRARELNKRDVRDCSKWRKLTATVSWGMEKTPAHTKPVPLIPKDSLPECRGRKLGEPDKQHLPGKASAKTEVSELHCHDCIDSVNSDSGHPACKKPTPFFTKRVISWGKLRKRVCPP